MNNKTTNWLIALLGILVVGAAIGMYYFYNQSVTVEQETQPADLILQDYNELEKAYESAIQELETAAEGDFSDIDILKQNLAQILTEIKEEKKEIDQNKEKRAEEIEKIQKEKAAQLRERLEMSKEVADAYLVQRLEQMEQRNMALQEQNQELNQEKTEIEQNLTRIQDNYEEQKASNSRLTAMVERINEEVVKLESQGQKKQAELAQLKEKRKEFEKKLEESNEIIEKQGGQIQELTTSLKKVNLDAYYYYFKDDPDKEARIFLTSQGVSNLYKNYFIQEKPDILVDFSLNKELFKDGLQKVEFQLFDEEGIEVLLIEKVIYEEDLSIQVPGEKLEADHNYSIKLKNGDEDLIIGGSYSFKI